MRLILLSCVLQALHHVIASVSSRKARKRPRVPITTTSTTTTPDAVDIAATWSFPFPVAIGVNITGITYRNRLIEQYDLPRVAATYGIDSIRILESQMALDHRHDLFTPSTEFVELAEYTPFGELEVGELIARSSESTVFTLPGMPDLLIKFQTNCYEVLHNHEVGDAVVHPLIFDQWYGMEAAAQNLALTPVFVSPPAPLCPTMTGICNFPGISSFEYQVCQGAGASVRYMLIRKSKGHSLRVSAIRMGGVMPFKLVMNVGAAMMELLERLHLDANIVHGDIYENNVFFEPIDSAGNYELRLIDFGRASRLVSDIPNTPTRQRNGRIHFLYTQWMIDGYQWAPRDDVMKMIQMLNHLLHTPNEYIQIEQHYMEMGYEAQKEFKMNGDLFSPIVPWGPERRLDAVEPLPVTEEVKGLIRRELEHILRMVRGLQNPNSVVPYDALREAFRNCADWSS